MTISHYVILPTLLYSLYIRPDNKVKLNSVMAFGIDFIFFPLFYHHPLVAEEGGYLDRLVMTEFFTPCNPYSSFNRSK